MKVKCFHNNIYCSFLTIFLISVKEMLFTVDLAQKAAAFESRVYIPLPAFWERKVIHCMAKPCERKKGNLILHIYRQTIYMYTARPRISQYGNQLFFGICFPFCDDFCYSAWPIEYGLPLIKWWERLYNHVSLFPGVISVSCFCPICIT